MLRVLRTGFKYFTYGLLIGLFLAPRPGNETRQQVMGWIGSGVNSLLDTVLGSSSEAQGGSPQPQEGSAPPAQAGGAASGAAQ